MEGFSMENKEEMIGIHQIWVNRSDFDNPELADSWDEYCIDANYEGWENAIKKVQKDYGLEASICVSVCYINLQKIRNAFGPVELGESKITID